jgi:hypothetical protein
LELGKKVNFNFFQILEIKKISWLNGYSFEAYGKEEEDLMKAYINLLIN